VGYQAKDKNPEYYLLVPKEKYRQQFLKNLISSYFCRPYQQLVSLVAEEENRNLQYLNELIKHLK